MAGSTYVWRGGRFVDKKTGEPMQLDPNFKVENILKLQRQIIRDIPPHIAPDGKYVGTRHQYLDALKRTDCVPPERRKFKYLDPRNAERNGQKFDREYAEEFKAARRKAFEKADLLPKGQ